MIRSMILSRTGAYEILKIGKPFGKEKLFEIHLWFGNLLVERTVAGKPEDWQPGLHWPRYPRLCGFLCAASSWTMVPASLAAGLGCTWMNRPLIK